jgi:hypothetical protein
MTDMTGDRDKPMSSFFRGIKYTYDGVYKHQRIREYKRDQRRWRRREGKKELKRISVN